MKRKFNIPLQYPVVLLRRRKDQVPEGKERPEALCGTLSCSRTNKEAGKSCSFGVRLKDRGKWSFVCDVEHSVTVGIGVLLGANCSIHPSDLMTSIRNRLDSRYQAKALHRGTRSFADTFLPTTN